MRSKIAKVLHPVAGRPMVWYMASLARRVADGNVVVVVGHQGERVKAFLEQEKDALDPLDIAFQTKQLGTGHAVQQAKSVLMPKTKPVAELCLILNGDTPLLTQATVEQLLAQHQQTQATVTILTTELSNPHGYGRVMRRAIRRRKRPTKKSTLGPTSSTAHSYSKPWMSLNPTTLKGSITSRISSD